MKPPAPVTRTRVSEGAFCAGCKVLEADWSTALRRMESAPDLRTACAEVRLHQWSRDFDLRRRVLPVALENRVDERRQCGSLGENEESSNEQEHDQHRQQP